MKTAHHHDTHQPICPHCGGQVTLRRRPRMDGTAVYFWRHLDNQSQSCRSRSHVAPLKSAPTASPAKARRRR